MSAKQIYIIHGWGSNLKEPWINWLKKELEIKKIGVKIFNMPNSKHPQIEEWVKFLEEKINLDEIKEEIYFIGHSIGAQTIMRFLEKLHKHKKIKGCVFVAPWLNLINLEPEEMEIAHPWINSEIHFDRVIDHCNNFLTIFSDNDPYVHLDETDKFKKNLGAKILIKKNQGHFEMTDKIPEILDFIK